MTTDVRPAPVRQLGGALLLLCAWTAFAGVAAADTLVVITSEASAPEFAAAADRLQAGGTPHRLRFLSTAQVARATDTELSALFQAADALILAAVFGDDAARVLERLRVHAPPTVVPLHGDAALLTFARVRGVPAFVGLRPDAAADALRQLCERPTPRAQAGAALSPEAFLARARRYRAGRGVLDLSHLLAFVLSPAGERDAVPAPGPAQPVRFLVPDAPAFGRATSLAQLTGDVVALFDYAQADQAGDRDTHKALCEQLAQHGLGCVSVLAGWGEPSIEALDQLAQAAQRPGLSLRALVLFQDFVVGGGAGAKRAEAALARLDVPLFKAIRMAERDVDGWRLSEDGLPDDSVHYRLAMPELQGVGQPFVVAAAGPAQTHAGTGLELRLRMPIADELAALARRIAAFRRLATTPNADKRVAIVYYNHPPGRHNIGADNLDVPRSLLSILRRLRADGYDTGPLPKDEQALLALLQARGVNLPEDQRALARMAERVARVSAADYQRYFDRLPDSARRRLSDGPLGGLLATVETGLSAGADAALAARVERVLGDVRHCIEGAVHPERDRALALLDQLADHYQAARSGSRDALARAAAATTALRATGIEGLSGWGPPPGRVMTHAGDLLVPGITFGKVFIGPQPPRGWELNEELLHANLAFPPPHQYLAFYEYLRSQHRADAVVHLGRHSTYEFLPGRRTGLGAEDFPRIVLGDLPSLYIYIVDGVGEGIQAKRRGQAVIIDHLTPSLSTTPLYDELLSLRQLVESYEAGAGVEGHAGARALSEIRATVERLHLRAELEASMRPELDARGIGYDEVDGELLVHEVGHYLTKLQERFMPHGLHVFGQPWDKPAVDRMLVSMAGPGKRPSAAERVALSGSPAREAEALLSALSGRFVGPGPGNDPVRTPEVLPTGRNFHALDASLLPTRLGYKLGAELAARARASAQDAQESEAIVLWASDTVRDEGAMIAFGMDMLGVSPEWNSRGIVQGLQRLPLADGRLRRDTTFVSSGLFRDLYGHLIDWLDRAVLVALDGSARTIARDHPELAAALSAAMAPIASERDPGDEALSDNCVAARWVEDARALLAQGMPAELAGVQAAARIFGDAPGTYGAGINRLAERSGAWHSRAELADTYVDRIGHAYGGGRAGQPLHAAFKRRLSRTARTYLGRASHLYGVLDNNDVFDYLGGLGMAVEAERGAPPSESVVQHADPDATGIEALPAALLSELRGRHLNPGYLQPLMAHGYAGARTMGSAFVENLWGWQVTSPHIVKSWVWDEVKAVYLDDKHGIGLSEFLSEGPNVHVKTNMQAVLLVAAHKGFWDARPEELQALSEAFARAVVEHGLPGSGHTRPDHPVMADIAGRLSPALAESFEAALEAAKGQSTRALVSELSVAEAPAQSPHDTTDAGGPQALWAMTAAGLLLFGGFFYERNRRRS